MTTIGLIRHGETEWNRLGKIQGRTDIPLNKTGEKQAKQCSVLLERSEWDFIVTSPLQRAKKTAEIMNERIQLPILEMNVFQERDYGEAEGMEREHREALFPTRAYPKMETREQLNNRVKEGLQYIETTYTDKNILLVSHGGVINTILAILSAGEIGSGKTKLHNACMSNIFYEGDKWHISDYNLTSHLL